ncbi:MAG: DUF4190 domain-containing protein [Chthoniobacterales bacterium]
MNDSAPQTEQKTSGLAITSLILGILSVTCCGLFTGVAAIICGHIAHSKIGRSAGELKGKRLAIAGFVLGYVSIVITIILTAIMLPGMSGAVQKGKQALQLGYAQQIAIAMRKGGHEIMPADSGITTVSQLKEKLVQNGMPPELIRGIPFENFLIGNVSASDSADTILIRSAPDHSVDAVIIHLSGDGRMLHHGETIPDKAPPRNPPYLAP